MESENRRLRRQIVDLQYDNTYMQKITEMQAEIILLKQQVINLKDENTRLNHLISKSSKNKTESSNQNDELSDDNEYFTADEGPDKIDRTCKYCGKEFNYPSRLRYHFKKCKKIVSFEI